MVNEDIYDADPEFRYLALSLTVKNRSSSAVGIGRWPGGRAVTGCVLVEERIRRGGSGRVYGQQTRLSTRFERERNGPDNNCTSSPPLPPLPG